MNKNEELPFSTVEKPSLIWHTIAAIFFQCFSCICAKKYDFFLLESFAVDSWIFIYLMFYNQIQLFFMVIELSQVCLPLPFSMVHQSMGSPCFLSQGYPFTSCVLPAVDLQLGISPSSLGSF